MKGACLLTKETIWKFSKKSFSPQKIIFFSKFLVIVGTKKGGLGTKLDTKKSGLGTKKCGLGTNLGTKNPGLGTNFRVRVFWCLGLFWVRLFWFQVHTFWCLGLFRVRIFWCQGLFRVCLFWYQLSREILKKMIFRGENDFFWKFPYGFLAPQKCPFHILKVYRRWQDPFKLCSAQPSPALVVCLWYTNCKAHSPNLYLKFSATFVREKRACRPEILVSQNGTQSWQKGIQDSKIYQYICLIAYILIWNSFINYVIRWRGGPKAKRWH